MLFRLNKQNKWHSQIFIILKIAIFGIFLLFITNLNSNIKNNTFIHAQEENETFVDFSLVRNKDSISFDIDADISKQNSYNLFLNKRSLTKVNLSFDSINDYVFDNSGYGNNFILVKNKSSEADFVSDQACIRNKCFYLDKSYLELDNNGRYIQQHDDFAFSFWIKPNLDSFNKKTIVYDKNNNFSLYIDKNNYLVATDHEKIELISNTKLKSDNWYYIVLNISEEKQELFINNNLEVLSDVVLPIDFKFDFVLANDRYNNYYNGGLDEFLIFNQILSKKQINLFYNDGKYNNLILSSDIFKENDIINFSLQNDFDQQKKLSSNIYIGDKNNELSDNLSSNIFRIYHDRPSTNSVQWFVDHDYSLKTNFALLDENNNIIDYFAKGKSSYFETLLKPNKKYVRKVQVFNNEKWGDISEEQVFYTLCETPLGLETMLTSNHAIILGIIGENNVLEKSDNDLTGFKYKNLTTNEESDWGKDFFYEFDNLEENTTYWFSVKKRNFVGVETNWSIPMTQVTLNSKSESLNLTINFEQEGNSKSESQNTYFFIDKPLYLHYLLENNGTKEVNQINFFTKLDKSKIEPGLSSIAGKPIHKDDYIINNKNDEISLKNISLNAGEKKNIIIAYNLSNYVDEENGNIIVSYDYKGGERKMLNVDFLALKDEALAGVLPTQDYFLTSNTSALGVPLLVQRKPIIDIVDNLAGIEEKKSFAGFIDVKGKIELLDEGIKLTGQTSKLAYVSIYLAGKTFQTQADELGDWSYNISFIDFINDDLGVKEYGISAKAQTTFELNKPILYSPKRLLGYIKVDFTNINNNQVDNREDVLKNIRQKRISDNLELSIQVVLILFILISIIFNKKLINSFRLSFFYLVNIITRLFGVVSKKEQIGGVIYDSLSKKPLSLAIVRLVNQHDKIISTHVTGGNGRFSFLPKPGRYKFFIQKNNYTFPSLIISGQDDDIYSNLYRGEEFEVGASSAADYSMALDPVNPDNYDRFKDTLSLYYVLQSSFVRIYLILAIPAIIASLALLIIRFDILNLLILGLYSVLTLFHIDSSKQGKKVELGIVYDSQTLKPVSLANLYLLRSYDRKVLKSILSDYQGRYKFVPPVGEYYIFVKANNYNFPAEKNNFLEKKFSDNYYHTVIKVSKNKSLISLNIPLDPK